MGCWVKSVIFLCGALLTLVVRPFNAVASSTQQAAVVEALPDLAQKQSMDGIDPKQAAAFWERWHLVTVRYRQDDAEQRFVYANDIAWKAIKKNSATFPDGSMFGKVAFKTATDPAFPNSVETTHYSRIQLMRKDAHRYPNSAGWGYALYTADPFSKSEDDHAVVAACHACHNLVPNRDFVFSRATFLDSASEHKSDEPNFTAHFKSVSVGDLSPYGKSIVNFFKVSGATVEYLNMPLFSGSTDESIAPLLHAAEESGLNYLMLDDKSKDRRFILVKALPMSSSCSTRPLEVILNGPGHNPKQAFRFDAPNQTRMVITIGQVCHGDIKWQARPQPSFLN